MSPTRARARIGFAALLTQAAGWCGALAVVVVLLVVFLGIYERRGLAVPVGSDTPTYIWRAEVVRSEGPGALRTSSPFPFDANGGNPQRPGVPLLAAFVGQLLAVEPWSLVFLLPGIGAALVALGAIAWGLGAWGDPRWAAVVYGLAAGASAPTILLANGYLDNLLALPVLLAAAVAVVLHLHRRRATAGIVGLIAASYWLHWPSGILFTIVLVAFAGLLAVWDGRTEQGRSGGWRSVAAHLVSPVVAGLALGVGGLLALGPDLTLPAWRTAAGFEVKVQTWLSRLRLPWVTAAAVPGAIGLASSADGLRRRSLLLLFLWLVPPVGAYAMLRMGAPVPAQRVFVLTLALWLLIAAGLVAMARRLWAITERRFLKPLMRLVALLLIAGASVWVVRSSAGSWDEHAIPSFASPSLVSRMYATWGYLRHLPAGTAIVVPVWGESEEDRFGIVPAFRRLRALAPPERVSDVAVYLGDPARLLAGEPTLRGEPSFDAVSRRYWAALSDMLRGRERVVLGVSPYTPGVATLARERPGSVLTDGVVVISGPRPPVPAPPGPVPAPSLGRLLLQASLVLFLLLVVGLGWSRALFDLDRISATALAPILGLCVVVVGGMVWGAVGVHFGGPGAFVLPTAAAGWLVGFRRWWDRRVVETGPAGR